MRPGGGWTPMSADSADSNRSSLRFRSAQSGDLALVLAFMRRFYAFFEYPFDEDEARRTLVPLLADGSPFGHAWILEDARQPVGYLVVLFGYSLEYRGRDAFVDELWVDPDHRGKGFGLAALEHAEKACA